MEMKTLNPVILRELIEKIEVYQIEGTGKNRTQRGYPLPFRRLSANSRMAQKAQGNS